MEEVINTPEDITIEKSTTEVLSKKRGPRQKYNTEEERIEARRAKARENYHKNKGVKTEEQKSHEREIWRKNSNKWKKNHKEQYTESKKKYFQKASKFIKLENAIKNNKIPAETLTILKNEHII